MKYAVIDVGSNSVRLLIWSDGKTLYKGINTTRLGEGLALSGKLSKSAMERTCLAVRDFRTAALQSGAESVYCFATAAVRSATNGGEFVKRVKAQTGVEVDVISGEEEAAIGLYGALGDADGGIIDIGGGSTELTLRAGGAVAYSKSLNIGAVRLFDLCGRDRNALEEFIAKKTEEYGRVNCNVPVYGVGGTATSLAALAQNMREYDPNRVQGYKLTTVRLKEILEKVFSISPESLAETSCLPLKRAEIIGGGGLLLLRLMEYLGLNEITVSEQDNLEGYLFKKVLG